jgi:hypothetical protein
MDPQPIPTKPPTEKRYEDYSMTSPFPQFLTLEEYYKACRESPVPSEVERAWQKTRMKKISEVSEVDLNSSRPD